MRALMLLGGSALLVVVLAAAWLNGGEVATLATADHEGRFLKTELWVVDLEGEEIVVHPEAVEALSADNK